MSICARFVGGPWANTYRALEDARDHWYVPILEPLSLRALAVPQDAAASVTVRAGTYRRDGYGSRPADGLYVYVWSAPR